MKSFIPYLNFDGNTGEAMKFYAKALGAELSMQTYADAGMAEPGLENRVVHARLSKGACVVMASDTQPGSTFVQGNNCYINIDCESGAEIEALFNALAAGGKVEMPVQDMFWGARFGMLTDQFGVHWMFNYELPKA